MGEQRPLPGFSLALITLLGVTELTYGIISAAVNPISKTMIFEGVDDLMTVFQGLRERNFQWKGYLKKKTLNMLISLASGGLKGASSSAQLFKKNAAISSNLLKTAFKNPGILKNVVATNVPIIFKELMKNNKKILITKIFPEVMTSGVKLF